MVNVIYYVLHMRVREYQNSSNIQIFKENKVQMTEQRQCHLPCSRSKFKTIVLQLYFPAAFCYYNCPHSDNSEDTQYCKHIRPPAHSTHCNINKYKSLKLQMIPSYKYNNIALVIFTLLNLNNTCSIFSKSTLVIFILYIMLLKAQLIATLSIFYISTANLLIDILKSNQLAI